MCVVVFPGHRRRFGLDGWVCVGLVSFSRVVVCASWVLTVGWLTDPMDLGWLTVLLFLACGLAWVGLWAVFIDLMNLVWKGYVGGVSYGCVGFCVCFMHEVWHGG